MSLFDRIASGELRKRKSESLATVATVATDERGVAGVAGVAEKNKIKPLTFAEQRELRRLVEVACDPPECEVMYLAALPFGQDSLTTYRAVVADLAIDTEKQEAS